MITFIKSYNIISIRNKLILLFVLNITDIIFTIILLNTGLFMELNFLMVNAVQDITTSILLKVLLPAIILLYLYTRIKKATISQLKKANVIINIVVIIYTLINISHLVWVALIPFFLLYIRYNLA